MGALIQLKENTSPTNSSLGIQLKRGRREHWVNEDTTRPEIGRQAARDVIAIYNELGHRGSLTFDAVIGKVATAMDIHPPIFNDVGTKGVYDILDGARQVAQSAARPMGRMEI